MKRNTTRFLLVLLMMLSLCFLCTACEGDTESVESTKSSTISPQKNPNEGRGDIVSEVTVNEVGLYEGFWISEITDQYDYILFDAEGNWYLCSGVDTIDEGYLWYDQESDTTYIYSSMAGAADGGSLELEGARLYITTLGYFNNIDAVVGQDDYTG